MTRTRTLVLAAVVLAIAGTALVLWLQRAPARTPGNQTASAPDAAAPSPAMPPSLAARLTLVAGATGDDAALVIRMYNARARQAAIIRDATAGGRPWTGTPISGADAPMTVRVDQQEWIRRTLVEHVDDDGTATPVGAGALTIVDAPDTEELTFDAASTYEVVMALAAGAVPPPDTRLRATLDLGSERVTTNRATVPAAPPTGSIESLVRRAVAAQALGRYQTVADVGAALVQAAPDDARGYWYRGIALEAADDREGALAAYRAAAGRIERGQEPPAGLFARIARLDGRARPGR